MNRNRFYFGAVLLILLLIIVWTSYSMLSVGREEESHKVSVIVEDSGNDRWIALRQGIEQAARDYNIDVNYVSTGKFSAVEEQISLIDRELDNGAKGVIVQMFTSDAADEIADISAQAAVILLETDVVPEDLYAVAGPDNEAIGSAAAEAVKKRLGEALSSARVGILAGNQNQLSMRQRLQGVKRALAEENAQIVWCADEESTQTQEGFYRIAGEKPAEVIIALSNAETEKMVDYLTVNGAGCLLYGVGCSDKAVYYLDKGIIDTLVVPNEFNMGYQSMETMAKQLSYHQAEAAGCEVEYLVIDRTNLYEEENQKVLFPLVQ